MITLENALETMIATLGVAGFIVTVVAAVIISLLVYIYASIALMVTAKRTRTANAWLAWIPLVNVALVAMIAKKSWKWVFIWFLHLIPVLGTVAFTVAFIYLWWKVCERRKLNGAWALLNLISTIGYLILVSITAWYTPKKN